MRDPALADQEADHEGDGEGSEGRDHGRRDEAHLPQLIERTVSNGMIWVCWPKKASGVPTDITEDVVREVALADGVVDVKVAAIDEVWSGLKLVRRLADR